MSPVKVGSGNLEMNAHFFLRTARFARYRDGVRAKRLARIVGPFAKGVGE